MQLNGFLILKINLDKYLVAAIIFTIIRFVMNIYDLGIVPSGFTADESANGYDAYCIAKTGKDMYGKSYPFLFNHHYMDYIEPLYNYILVLIVKAFGYSNFNIRLLSATIGAITVLSTFYLGRELFNKKIGIIAAVLLVFSPWHFVFSRIAFRGIFVPLLSCISLLFLYKSLKDKKYLIYASVSMGTMLFTYSIAKAYVPLLVITFLVFHYKNFISAFESKKERNKLIFAAVLLAIIALPIYYFSFFSIANHRFEQISIFSNESPLKTFAINYLKHLGMLITGGSEKSENHEIYGTGIIYWEYVFVLISSFYFMLKQNNSIVKYLFILLLVCFIPPSLTNNHIPHILRSISIFPILEILVAYGIYEAYLFIKEKNYTVGKNVYVISIAIAFLINATLINYFYFKHYRINSKKWFDLEIRQDFISRKAEIDRSDNIIVYGKDINLFRALIFECHLVSPEIAQDNSVKAKYQWFFSKEEFNNSRFSKNKNILVYNLDEKVFE